MTHHQGRVCVKTLTLSDVQGRLAVPTDMAAIMPRADPERDIPIKVLDELGRIYEFCLSGRKGRYIKPVFQASEWRAFIRHRGAKQGDVIYFCRDVNQTTHAEYRIVLRRNFLPNHPGL